MTPRSSQRCTSARDSTGPPKTIWKRARVATVLGEQRAQRRDLRRGGLERVTHAEPTVAEARRAPERGARLTTHEDRWPRSLLRLRFERDFVEREELAVVRDGRPRTTGAGRPRSLRRRAGRASRSRARRRPTPGRNHDAPTPNSKRPPERMSTVCTPRAVVNGWRKPMLNTWVPRRMRSVFAARNARYANASYTGVSGGTGGWSSPGYGELDIARVNTRCSGNQTDS